MHRELQQKLQAMPSLPTGFPSVMPSVITLGVSVGGWFFLFATELPTEMGFTDDCYTDGRDPSVTLSVLFLPTDFIAVTDGISPSVKLDNVVVNVAPLYWPLPPSVLCQQLRQIIVLRSHSLISLLFNLVKDYGSIMNLEILILHFENKNYFDVSLKQFAFEILQLLGYFLSWKRDYCSCVWQ
jgi:hypothetical protein